MKKIKNVLFLLFLMFVFLSTSCAQSIRNYEHKAKKAFQEMEKEFQGQETQEQSIQEQSTSGISKQEIILKACAYGKTTKEARISALKGLSQQIISQVQAKEELYKKREQGKVYRKYVSSSEIVTKSLLKGVIFKNFGKTPAGYKVCAYFTKNSLKETIGYLKSVLSVDFSKMNRAQLKEALTKAGFLLNLAFLSPNAKNIEEFAKKKIEQINVYLNYGCLVVNVIPSNAKIIINGKIYSSGEPIYLPPEITYIVRIEAPGYEPVIKNVYLGRGEKRSLSIELVKKLKVNLEVYVFSNIKFIIDEASTILSQAGFRITSSPVAPNAIYIKLKDATIKVDEYTKHTLYMYVVAYKGKEKFLEIRGRTRGFFTTPETEVAIIKKKTDKLLRVVLKRLINKLDIDKFKGEKEINYSKLFGQPVSSQPVEKEVVSEKPKKTSNQESQIVSISFPSLKEFAKWLVKSYEIRDLSYDILEPDPSGGFYTSIFTHKRYNQEVEEGADGKYLLLIKFKIGYPKNVLNIAKNYLSKFCKKSFKNISFSEVYKHNYTVFLGVYSMVLNAKLWNFGLRLYKVKLESLRKSLNEEKKKKVLEINFKDASGITIFGLKYKYSYGYATGYLEDSIFVLDNVPNGWIVKKFGVPWIWEVSWKRNLFMIVDGWKEITIRGFIPKEIGNKIKKVEYKF